MANELDELTGPVNPDGRDVNVIAKQIPVKVGVGSTVFEVLLWILGIIPGVVFLFMKIRAKNYLQKLQQKLQHDASQIDNYLEQRVRVLENTAALVNKSVELDKSTFTQIAALRSGNALTDEQRNAVVSQIDDLHTQINVALENYPTLRSQDTIQKAMQENSYLQKEITAAREIYNDTVHRWNSDIFSWRSALTASRTRPSRSSPPAQVIRRVFPSPPRRKSSSARRKYSSDTYGAATRSYAFCGIIRETCRYICRKSLCFAALCGTVCIRQTNLSQFACKRT